MILKNRIIKIITFLGFILCLSSINAQNQYDVYAGFIFHFGKYVQWPDNMQTGDFVIGVSGNSPMKSKLDNLASSKNINGRKIVIKKVSNAADLDGCHILFVPDTDLGNIGAYKGAAKSKHVMIVTEGEGNITKGSVLNFVEKEGKVRFEYSKSEADANGLKVSSDLVKLSIPK